DITPMHMQCNKMLQTVKLLKDTAVIRETSQQTIESHLFKAYKSGHPISWEIFFNGEEEKAVLAVREDIDEPRLKPLKDALPEGYDYTKIKAVLVKNEWM